MRSTSNVEADPARRTRVVAPLLLIIAAGAALRFYGLDIQSLWNDELSSWARASAPTWTEVVQRSAHDHPPGHIVFLHVWMRYVGDSERDLRLSSAIAGTLAIPAIFLLGRRLYSDTEGLIAAAVLAVAWMPVYYSQEARANMPILLFAILTTYWLIDIVRSLRAGQGWPLGAACAYVVTAVLACYAHYFGLLLIALQGIFCSLLLLRHPGALWRIMLLYGVVAIPYVPWMMRAYAALSVGAPIWLPAPRPSDLWVLVEFFFNRSAEFAAVAVALWLSLGVRGGLELWRRPQDLRALLTSPTMALVLWLVVPVVVVYARSVLVAPAFNDRNFVIVAPAAYLLTARAFARMPLRRGAVLLVSGVFVATLLWHLFAVRRHYTLPAKDQFRHATAHVLRYDRAHKKVIIAASAWNPRYFDYYLEQFGSHRRVDLVVIDGNGVDELMRLVDERSPDEVWYLAAHRMPPRDVIQALKQRLRLRADKRLFVARAMRFRPKKPPPACGPHCGPDDDTVESGRDS